MLMKMYFQIFLITIIMVELLDARRRRSIIRIDRFEICRCGDSQQECIVSDYDYKVTQRENTDSIITLKFSLEMNVNRIKLEVETSKCKSRDSLDSCEQLGTIKPLNSCELIAMKGTMWQDFSYSFQPNFICPFIKGNYETHNATVNGEMFKIFPISGWYWKLKLNYYNETGMNYLLTFCADGYVT